MIAASVSRRRVTPEDDAFLFELYCSTRTHDLGAAELDRQQLEAIIRIQFIGKRQQYVTDFPDAEHQIILLGGNPIGRSIVERRTKGAPWDFRFQESLSI